MMSKSVQNRLGYTARASLHHSARRRLRPTFDRLEDRLAPATFMALNTNDAGAGSLRQAILDANAAVGADVITFDPGAFSTPQTITLTSGELTVTGDLTLSGPGAANLSVSGNNASRAFQINTGVTATLSGLTVRDGRVGTGSSGGAGLRSQGTLTLSDCVFRNNTNTSTNGFNEGGGGLINDYGTMTISRCLFTNNTSPAYGGLFNKGGTLTMTHSAVTQNTANDGTNGGGGMRNGYSGTSTLINTTFSGNTANGSNSYGGGGLVITSGSVTLTNCTFSNNSQTGNLGGGGIYNAATVTMHNTLVAGNTATTGGPDLAGSVVSTSSFNLVGDGTGLSGISNGVNGNQIGTAASPINPLLAALQDNGGPTPTHALLIGSPAINTGSNARAVDGGGNPLTTDQRGVGYPRIAGGTVDIGALEGDLTPPTVVSMDDGDLDDLVPVNQAVAYTITFSEDMDATTVSAADFDNAGTATMTLGTIAETAPGVFTVQVTPTSGGTLILRIPVGAVIADTAGNNLVPPVQDSDSVTVDAVPPNVVSVTRVGANSTNAATVQFTVAFSEAVTGVAAGNFTLAAAGVTGASISSVSGSGTTWTVTVNTGTGDGSVGLNLTSAAGITDAAGNALAGVPFTGQVYTVDRTAPTVVVSSPAPALTNTSPILVTVTFSEAVAGFTVGDLTISNGTVSNFAGSGTTYTFSLTPSGQGLLAVNIAAGVSLDSAGNGNAAAATFSRTYDSIAPTVTINQAAGQADPTASGPILFTVVFSEAVTGFTAADIVLGGTAGATTAVLSGNGTTFTVTVSGMTRGGTVTVTIGAGAALDAAGNSNAASTSTDNGVTFGTDSVFNGVVFEDFANDGVRQASDPARAGVTVYVDLDGDGVFDATEPSAVSASDGSYRLTVTTPGTFTVRLVLPERWRPTTADSLLTATLVGGEDLTGIDLGVLPATSVVPVEPVAQLFPAAPTNATAAWLTGVFRAVLNRDPEAAALTGFEALLNQGTTHEQAAQIIWESPEHRGLQVESYYQSYLGRASDAAGKAFWVNFFMAGAGETDVVWGFVTSLEYQTLHSGDAAFVRSLYSNLLGREASAQEESAWVQALQNGVSRTAAAQVFLASEEHYQLAVNAYYSAYLHRANDAPGEAGWLQVPRTARALETIGVGFLDSAEFLANAQAGV